MRNAVANSTQNNHEVSVTHNPTDFRSLMNYFWNFMDSSNAEFSDLSPKIQVTENKDAVKVVAEIPGIDEKEIDLKISADGYLSISGEKKNEIQANAKDNYFSEISYGMFRRTLQLPWDLDYDATTANYNNGVLTVSIPKSQTEKQKFKKISVAKS
ncbi:MAG: Hsp20/alpha crystallin family protein [Alphaproteobacteria bacterium]|nr:Hsp20/alpha crystallin family protein [Alphaproteobacteria bacterium]